jgi:hypothetical protein
MRLEEESKPIGRGADLRLPRRNVRGEPNTGVRSQIPRPDFVVHRGPEEVPEKRPDLRRRRPPRDEQGQSVVSGRTFFFLLGFDCLSYRSAADLACKWPVRPITVFCKSSYCIIYLLCPRPPGDFFFYFEFVFFFGKRGEARGNGPADRGRRRKLASRTIWDFAFGSPLFFNFVFEFKLLFESFPFFIAARAQPFILYIIT